MNCHRFVVAVFVFSLSAGVFAQTTETKSFQVAGVARTYVIHVPSGLSNNPPLVFNIHGYNIDGALMRSITQMDKVADREKFIIIYPSALNKSWNMSGGDDLTFLRALVDTIDAEYHIDRNRVYAIGFLPGRIHEFFTRVQIFGCFCRHSSGVGHAELNLHAQTSGSHVSEIRDKGKCGYR